jgi:hypothetical protein
MFIGFKVPLILKRLSEVASAVLKMRFCECDVTELDGKEVDTVLTMNLSTLKFARCNKSNVRLLMIWQCVALDGFEL